MGENRAEMLFMYLKGSLDETSVPELEKNLLDLIAGGTKQLIVDCSQLESINTAGLRMLMNISKRVLQVDGRLALHSPSAAARDTFERTGFAIMSRIYESREEAVAGVAASGLLSSLPSGAIDRQD
jgi:anti-anti-sigma factor